LRAAVAAAQAGDVIMLGPGTYTLTQALTIGPGVALQGGGAGKTTIDGTGLGVGMSFDRSTPDRKARIEGVTVTGADTCVQVGNGATGVQIQRVVVRDCRVTGVAVQPGGAAEVASATLVGNATAVASAGTTRIKNSLLTNNTVALAVEPGGTLASTYNDLFGNQKDYSGVAPGEGDLSQVVTFADFKTHDFRLVGQQPSTDKGDPGDDFSAEPAPNGGRINLGAFGGTAEAEMTAPSSAVGGKTTGGPAPTADQNAAATPSGVGFEKSSDADGACNVGPKSDAGGLFAFGMLLLAARVRRRRTWS
jgi:uncharacterized protein (TIGR03382 family)